jgi:hypothetical protein
MNNSFFENNRPVAQCTIYDCTVFVEDIAVRGEVAFIMASFCQNPAAIPSSSWSIARHRRLWKHWRFMNADFEVSG